MSRLLPTRRGSAEIATTVALVVLLAMGWGISSGSPAVRATGESSANGRPKPDARTEVSPQEAPLVVHEWGTFTSFSGSDGVKLEFRPLVDQDLPSFVYNRAKISGSMLLKSSITAIQRMETPVTYFYTPVERDVQVRVAFPEGLLTEFYPPVREYGPPVDASRLWFAGGAERQATTGDSKAPLLKNSFLDWGTVHLIPTDALAAQVADQELARRIGRLVEATMVPDAGPFDHYGAARATDSAIVQVRHKPEQLAAKKVYGVTPADYFEKFLFYRGLGNFSLPLSATVGEDGSVQLQNAGDQEIRSLFFVSVDNGAIRYRRYERVAAGETLTMEPAEDASNLDQLSRDVTVALVAEGLYEKEAAAMVRTWKSSWFGENGTRVFYMLPQEFTDQVLPLQVTPVPDETVRVLVGRMEVMTPEAERGVLALVLTSAAARERHHNSPQSEESFRSPVWAELLGMGRLAEPALVRAMVLAKQPNLQNEARQLIRELRVERDPTVDTRP